MLTIVNFIISYFIEKINTMEFLTIEKQHLKWLQLTWLVWSPLMAITGKYQKTNVSTKKLIIIRKAGLN